MLDIEQPVWRELRSYVITNAGREPFTVNMKGRTAWLLDFLRLTKGKGVTTAELPAGIRFSSALHLLRKKGRDCRNCHGIPRRQVCREPWPLFLGEQGSPRVWGGFAMTVILSHQEKSDQYARVIALGLETRVIVCRHDQQWIIQRKKGGIQPRWLSLGYCLSKSTVLRLWAGLGETPCPALAALPDRKRGPSYGA
jgi:hypothetical protein